MNWEKLLFATFDIWLVYILYSWYLSGCWFLCWRVSFKWSHETAYFFTVVFFFLFSVPSITQYSVICLENCWIMLLNIVQWQVIYNSMYHLFSLVDFRSVFVSYFISFLVKRERQWLSWIHCVCVCVSQCVCVCVCVCVCMHAWERERERERERECVRETMYPHRFLVCLWHI